MAELYFRSGNGRCAATLYLPARRAPGQRLGCVVLCNGFSLTRRDGLPRFAEHFATAGLAALTFDFRHLGDSSGEPRQLVDYRRQQADLAAAIAFARDLDMVDGRRVAVWGFSNGGGLVVRVAADDPRIAAAVALFPMVDGLAFAMASDPRNNARLLVNAVRDRFGRSTVRVPIVGAPGTVRVFTQPSARPGLDRALGAGSRWRNEVCAGPFLRASSFRPVRVAGKVRCPLLVCVADNDTLVPQRPILRAAERAPRATLRHYPIDHLDALSAGADFDRVVRDQTDFLVATLEK
ncbi:alpha/beta hydrolase [Nocardia sp. NPDC059177]|uniref:alpha/beta hydrolase n=1 Tax=Nocardia sp. NPDC059177 TaxID=3346759 RepID=UPI0036817B4D